MRKLTKKVITGVLLGAMTLSLAACGDSRNGSNAVAETTAGNNENETEEESKNNTESNGELTKIAIGVDYGALAYLQVIAKDKGFFADNGIEAELVNYAAGIDTLNGVVLNEVQIGAGYDYAACTRLAEKSNLRLVATIIRDSKDARWFATTVEGLETAADLKGKNIGLLQGTLEEYLWAKELESVGLTTDDVEISYFSSKAENITALATGGCDAAVGNKEYEKQLSAIENMKTINDQGDIGQNSEAYIFADESFLNDNPEVIEGYLKAIAEAAEFIETNEDEAAELSAAYLTLKKEDVISSFAAYNYDISFTQEDYDHIESIAEWCGENGVVEPFEVKDYMNIDAIKNVFPDKVTYSE